ncbi:hypothetical protein [Sphaerisporangium perillae]|uniref:hypothetical protein n=1 Tax=Sphaerisporangium perillae TaxID=2935860 RepID=UPI002010A122|nr:hypothetical protein [Sphaerisporangium perillae]
MTNLVKIGKRLVSVVIVPFALFGVVVFCVNQDVSGPDKGFGWGEQLAFVLDESGFGWGDIPASVQADSRGWGGAPPSSSTSV